jgi:hypothetical protein
VSDDIRKLQEDIHIVVSTPGRVCDMILRRALRVDWVNIVVTQAAAAPTITSISGTSGKNGQARGRNEPWLLFHFLLDS